MKSTILNTSSERIDEIVDALKVLGMNRPIALVLAHMSEKKETSAWDLEKATRLRQPEISISTKILKEKGWINTKDRKKSLGKGRPSKIYSLKKDFSDIVLQLETEQKNAASLIQGKIDKLKKLTGS